MVAFVEFQRHTIEVFGCCSFSILFSFSGSEVFAGEAFVLGEVSFPISLVFGMDIGSLRSSKPKNIFL